MNRVTRVQNFARAGFLARGVVYMLLGYFALTTAGSASDGTSGVFRQIRDGDLGVVLLVLLGIGLAGYGIYRLYGAAIDIENSRSGWTAKGRRIGHVASGLAHLALAFTAVQLAVSGGGSSGGDTQQAAAGTLLSLPLGSTLLVLIGIGFALAAAEQAGKAITAKFMGKLDPDAPGATEWIGRAGYAARAVVFAIIGASVIDAGMNGNSGGVEGMGGALDALAQSGAAYTLVAIGLILFGVFSLVMARYRQIRDGDVIAHLRRGSSTIAG